MATVTKRRKYWRAQIRRLGFPPQRKTFDTHAEAEAWARVVESEMDRGIFSSRVEAERTTLAKALERYRNEISSRKAHPAQESQRISRWLCQPLAHRYLASLRGADFAQYRDMRRADGRAENTICLELALMSHLFEIARKDWGTESLLNPLNNIRNLSGSRERDRRLRDGEYSLIADALDNFGNPCARQAVELSSTNSLLLTCTANGIDGYVHLRAPGATGGAAIGRNRRGLRLTAALKHRASGSLTAPTPATHHSAGPTASDAVE